MPELEKTSHSLGMPKDVMDLVTVIVASFCQWSIKLHKLEQSLRCDNRVCELVIKSLVLQGL
jgi:hypothetical protein